MVLLSMPFPIVNAPVFPAIEITAPEIAVHVLSPRKNVDDEAPVPLAICDTEILPEMFEKPGWESAGTPEVDIELIH